MKLTAIMLIVNAFFAQQQGIEVVSKIIDPIKHISADTALNDSEYKVEKVTISTAATFVREQELLPKIDEAIGKLFNFYDDIDSFQEFIDKASARTGARIEDVSIALDAIISLAKNDLLSKLSEFDAHVLKRDVDLGLLEDSKLLRQVIVKASRFFSELRTLIAQTTVTDVEFTSDFIPDAEIAKLTDSSTKYFKALSA